MGILEGALRMMPAWEWNFLGHTITFSVLIPFALPLGIILGGAALWPFFEQWATGDRSWHNINDRPRNAPIRTATGIAVVIFYGVLWAEGANDVIANALEIPLYTVTWISRVLIFVAPVAGFIITRRICLALQRKDRAELLHGYESGIIRQLPNGAYIEVHQPVNEEARAVLEAKKVPALLPGLATDDATWAARTAQGNRNGVPPPKSGGMLGRARAIANRAFAETVAAEGNGHGYGGGNGHGPDGEEHAAVGVGHAELASGDGGHGDGSDGSDGESGDS
jgi:ubiquinol-cytochrome c reductase cytochrome b subunit